MVKIMPASHTGDVALNIDKIRTTIEKSMSTVESARNKLATKNSNEVAVKKAFAMMSYPSSMLIIVGLYAVVLSPADNIIVPIIFLASMIFAVVAHIGAASQNRTALRSAIVGLLFIPLMMLLGLTFSTVTVVPLSLENIPRIVIIVVVPVIAFRCTCGELVSAVLELHTKLTPKRSDDRLISIA